MVYKYKITDIYKLRIIIVFGIHMLKSSKLYLNIFTSVFNFNLMCYRNEASIVDNLIVSVT